MATPAGDSHQVASGGVIAAGRHLLPSWVPPTGKFQNISLNILNDVKPAGWPTTDGGGPFVNWAGGVYAKDFSSRGAMVIHGSGHLSQGAPVWAGVWCFDLSTLRWVGRNIPSAPLQEQPANTAYYNQYYESLSAGTEGHPYAPHTYDALVYQPSNLGGGASGSMLRTFYAGTGTDVKNAIHRFDLSSPTSPPTRVIDDLVMGSDGNYAMTASDDARGGYWIMQTSGVGPLKFVHYADWSVSSWNVAYGTYGDNSLIYLPAPFDCLVGMGRADMANTIFNVYVCPIVGGVPQGFTQVATSGTPPSDGRSGGVWSELLNCIVAYQGRASYIVHKLTPPTGNLTTGTWAWASETLSAVNGETPSQALNSQNGLPFDNGAWSRFMEVKSARCFIWGEGVNNPVQAWRLTGM